MLKVLVQLIFVFSVLLIIAYGEFGNDFLVISLIMAGLCFTFYAYLHWLLRWVAIGIHIFIILVVENAYLRELIMQLACYQLG